MSGAKRDGATERQAVHDYLASKTALDLTTIGDGDPLLASGCIDSLQLIELIIWLEYRGNAPVDSERLFVDDDITIASIARYLDASGAAAAEWAPC